MNILYIHTHDTGTYIEPYGRGVATPHLMALAREGILFRHAYAAAPTCSPSRSALLTGMWPHAAGMLGLAHRGFALSDPRKHLAHYLGEQGMETVLCGMQHESKNRSELGYGRVLSPGREAGDFNEIDRRNAHRVAEYLAQEKNRPFFLSFGMSNTHRPFPLAKGDPGYAGVPDSLYDSPQNRADMAGFQTAVTNADDCVGIVLDALRESGLDRETVVLFTTDHGIAFPGMKCNLYDAGIRVALILKIPGHFGGKMVSDALVSHLDIFPTLCDLLEIEKPQWLQGTSLLPLLQGQRESVREDLFAEVTYHAAYEPMRGIRTARYKLIRLYNGLDQAVPANLDDGPAKDFVITHGWLDQTRAPVQLYDLYLDPVERVNLAGDRRYETVLRDLDRRLERWMRETRDPLLDDKRAPKPEGAVVNRQSCLSPEELDFE